MFDPNEPVYEKEIIPYNISNFRHFRYFISIPYQELCDIESKRNKQASYMPQNQEESII